ncbi:N-acetylneuraminate synthase family protein [Candidatus Pelagibacter sp. HIMB1517]|uniref:N-acetylneuraminate synthase family protein n=1 Tax=Candidatus Pelagibacter sp. HIMB1517 TaxID=3413341 RepID=UPI003F87615C
MNTFLIAEIGINHNGDIELAKKLIDEAKEAGFDSVKFQKRDIDLVYDEAMLSSSRESPWGKTQRDQKEGLEFGKKEYDEIDEYCKKKNIHWFASAWDINSLKFLDNYSLKYHKVASAMIIDKNLLKEIAKRSKYTFISTGMSSTENIDEAVKIFKEYSCPFELMHCVSTYPMKTENANLNTIDALKKKYKCKVGYSGHETGIAVSLAAFSKGISSLERHITLDRSMYGSDQSASLEPRGAKELISMIRKMEIAFGEEKLGDILKEEIPIAQKLRAHIK